MSIKYKKMLAFRYAALPEAERRLVRAVLSVDELNSLDKLLSEIKDTRLEHLVLTKDSYSKILRELSQSLDTSLSGWDRLISASDKSDKVPQRLIQVIHDVASVEKDESTYEF